MLILSMLKKFFFTSLTLAIIYILISQNYIYQFFVPNSGIGYFADWDYFIKGLECGKIKSDCETFIYGKIFFYYLMKKTMIFFIQI